MEFKVGCAGARRTDRKHGVAAGVEEVVALVVLTLESKVANMICRVILEIADGVGWGGDAAGNDEGAGGRSEGEGKDWEGEHGGGWAWSECVQ